MLMWDKWRAAIASGDGGSWPRDAFEGLLDALDEEREDAVAAEREACAKVCRDKKPWGNLADEWAAELLEAAACDIEARSNNEVRGDPLAGRPVERSGTNLNALLGAEMADMSYEVWGEPQEHYVPEGWWTDDEVVFCQETVKELLAEPIYEGGEKHNGISERFLARLTLLREAVQLARSDDPLVIDARRVIGDA